MILETNSVEMSLTSQHYSFEQWEREVKQHGGLPYRGKKTLKNDIRNEMC